MLIVCSRKQQSDYKIKICFNTYNMFRGSFLLFTAVPFSHFSFFLEGNFVSTNLLLACVGLTSHQGASSIVCVHVCALCVCV